MSPGMTVQPEISTDAPAPAESSTAPTRPSSITTTPSREQSANPSHMRPPQSASELMGRFYGRTCATKASDGWLRSAGPRLEDVGDPVVGGDQLQKVPNRGREDASAN